MREVRIKIHETAIDGLPDPDDDSLHGRVAAIFDGDIVSAHVVRPGEYAHHDQLLRSYKIPHAWMGSEDVGHQRLLAGVTHWVEFPYDLSMVGRESELVGLEDRIVFPADELATIEVLNGMLVVDFTRISYGNMHGNIVIQKTNGTLDVWSEQHLWAKNHDEGYITSYGEEYKIKPQLVKPEDAHPDMLPFLVTDTWKTGIWGFRQTHTRQRFNRTEVRLRENKPRHFTANHFAIIQSPA